MSEKFNFKVVKEIIVEDLEEDIQAMEVNTQSRKLYFAGELGIIYEYDLLAVPASGEHDEKGLALLRGHFKCINELKLSSHRE